MILKAYFDGSTTDGLSMSLAAVAADDSVWVKLEPQWVEILNAYGAHCLHMRDAAQLRGEFAGWSARKRDGLLEDIHQLLCRYREDLRIRQFSCAVDLRAHTECRNARWLPSPERICARIVFPRIHDWYMSFPPDQIVGLMEAYFDRNERFMRHIHEDWTDNQIRRNYPAWTLIRTIAPTDTVSAKPLQVADVMAWSTNRIKASQRHPIDAMTAFAYRFVGHSLLGTHDDVDATALRERAFLESGIARKRLFKKPRRTG